VLVPNCLVRHLLEIVVELSDGGHDDSGNVCVVGGNLGIQREVSLVFLSL
jgi:hypothetical protein